MGPGEYWKNGEIFLDILSVSIESQLVVLLGFHLSI